MSYFDTAWDKVYSEKVSRTTIPEEDWKASGRATKANPDKENKDWWLKNGPLMVDKWIAWRGGERRGGGRGGAG